MSSNSDAADVATERGRGLVTALGGGLVVLGSLLPWISVRTFAGNVGKTGIESGGDGVWSLALGVVILALGLAPLVGARVDQARVVLVILSVAAGAIAIVNLADVTGRARDIENRYVDANAGAGLYVIIVGVVLVLGITVMTWQRGPREARQLRLAQPARTTLTGLEVAGVAALTLAAVGVMAFALWVLTQA